MGATEGSEAGAVSQGHGGRDVRTLIAMARRVVWTLYGLLVLDLEQHLGSGRLVRSRRRRPGARIRRHRDSRPERGPDTGQHEERDRLPAVRLRQHVDALEHGGQGGA